MSRTRSFYLLLTLFFTLLILVTAGKTLQFGFWKDDWASYWGARTFQPIYYKYWFHPGTVVYFTTMAFLFPPNSIYWQVGGIIWKVIASVSIVVCFSTFFKSKEKGIVAGTLFAVSQFGLDAVGWPSATVVLIDVSVLMFTVALWIHFLQSKQKSIYIPLFFLILSCVVDPFRTIPILLCIPLLITTYRPAYISTLLQQSKKLILLIPFAAVGVWIYGIPLYKETVIYKFSLRHGNDIHAYISKLYVFNNYFNTMRNIVVGLVLRVPEELSTGVYDRLGARLGFVFIVLCMIIAVNMYLKKDRYRFEFLFFLSWLILFYIPNHLSEPRLTMGATHRYVVIASVGYIGMVILALYSIKSSLLRYLILCVLLLLSMNATILQTKSWVSFRSRNLLTLVWNRVNDTIPHDEGKYIIVMNGSHPILSNALNYSATAPLGALRFYKAKESFPLLLTSVNQAVPLLCNPDSGYTVLGLYAWTIDSVGGVYTSIDTARATVRRLASQEQCQLNE